MQQHSSKYTHIYMYIITPPPSFLPVFPFPCMLTMHMGVKDGVIPLRLRWTELHVALCTLTYMCTCTSPSLPPSHIPHHMDVKDGVAPLRLRRADDPLEGQGVVEPLLLRQVQVGAVEVVKDCNEHLSLAGIHQCVMLGGSGGGGERERQAGGDSDGKLSRYGVINVFCNAFHAHARSATYSTFTVSHTQAQPYAHTRDTYSLLLLQGESCTLERPSVVTDKERTTVPVASGVIALWEGRRRKRRGCEEKERRKRRGIVVKDRRLEARRFTCTCA